MILIGILGCGTSTRSTSFTYQVHVLEETSLHPIQGAQVRIMIPGMAPATGAADKNGLAFIQVSAAQVDQLGRLMVEAPGYAGYEAGEYINLTEGALPKTVYLKPMGEGVADEELTRADTPEPPSIHTPRPGSTATNTPSLPMATPKPRPTDTPEPPTSTPNHRAGDTRVSPKDGAVMVYVPAGVFQMGSDPDVDPDAASDEQPVHTVALDAFWIDQTEVTNAQYTRCVDDGACEPSEYADNTDYHGDDYPVVGVSWYDAVAYCTWAEKRLPTEAEWEYAARGPEARIYPWGDAFDGTRCNFCDVNCERSWADKAVDDGYAKTAPVGSFPDGVSWTGALDMAGNIWEWVADWYGEYPSGRRENPTGPEMGEYRVLRGGGWTYYAWLVRAAFRNWLSPSFGFDNVGFRCAIAARQGP